MGPPPNGSPGFCDPVDVYVYVNVDVNVDVHVGVDVGVYVHCRL